MKSLFPKVKQRMIPAYGKRFVIFGVVTPNGMRGTKFLLSKNELIKTI